MTTPSLSQPGERYGNITSRKALDTPCKNCVSMAARTTLLVVMTVTVNVPEWSANPDTMAPMATVVETRLKTPQPCPVPP